MVRWGAKLLTAAVGVVVGTGVAARGEGEAEFELCAPRELGVSLLLPSGYVSEDTPVAGAAGVKCYVWTLGPHAGLRVILYRRPGKGAPTLAAYSVIRRWGGHDQSPEAWTREAAAEANCASVAEARFDFDDGEPYAARVLCAATAGFWYEVRAVWPRSNADCETAAEVILKSFKVGTRAEGDSPGNEETKE